jgi:LPXTG-motif cell wall-anchored protein
MYRLFGVAVFILGVVLLVMGISAADSIGSQFSRFFTGNPTDKSIWMMIGGIVCILLGSGGFMFSRGRSNRS